MARVIVALHEAPPSKNETHSWHWAKRSREKKRWQNDLVRLFASERLPKGNRRARVSYTVYWAKHGPLPDPQNLTPWLDLVTADALTLYGFYADDKDDMFVSSAPHVERSIVSRSETRIAIEYDDGVPT